MGAFRGLPGVTGVAHGGGMPPSMGIVFGNPQLEGIPVLEGRAFTAEVRRRATCRRASASW